MFGGDVDGGAIHMFGGNVDGCAVHTFVGDVNGCAVQCTLYTWGYDNLL